MDKHLISREELLKRLGINKARVIELEKEGLPVYPFSNKNIQYDPELVFKWLEKNKLRRGRTRT